MHQSSYSFEIF